MVRRLLNCTKNEITNMTALQLKESIRSSEGRVVLAQNYVGFGPLVQDTTNAELSFAFGADMVFFNGFPMDGSDIPAFETPIYENNELIRKHLTLEEMQDITPGPLGVYLECGLADDVSSST